MRDLYNRWWHITTGWEKSLATGLILTLVLDTLRLIFWQGSAHHVILWAMLTYTALGMIYYRALWYKFEPLTDFGAAIGEHLHTYGDLLLEKNGGRYTATPLTRHD